MHLVARGRQEVAPSPCLRAWQEHNQAHLSSEWGDVMGNGKVLKERIAYFTVLLLIFFD